MGVLDEITREVTKAVGLRSGELNCVNLNYYPCGGGVGWHADDEFLFDSLERETAIISLSLCGSEDVSRLFEVRLRSSLRDATDQDIDGSEVADTSELARSLLLGHGDLMTMEGLHQLFYLHRVWPGDGHEHVDDPRAQGERINLTWRTIVRHLDGSEECRGMCCPLAHPTA